MNTYTKDSTASDPWSASILKNYSDVTTSELLRDIHKLQEEVKLAQEQAETFKELAIGYKELFWRSQNLIEETLTSNKKSDQSS